MKYDLIKKSDNRKSSIELLVNGESAFSRIITRIREAESFIYLNIFIWRDDIIGNTIARELLLAADRGVKIIISKDLYGSISEKIEETRQSFFHKQFIPSLIIQHAVFKIFRFNSGKNLIRHNYNENADLLEKHPNVKINILIKKDHSKFYIFDFNSLIFGGMNIEDRSAFRWFDYMLEFHGKDHVNHFLDCLTGLPKMPLLPVNFIINSIEKKEFPFKETVIQLIRNAKKEIIVGMAYWGDKDISDALIDASNQGKLLTIFLPGKANVQNDTNFCEIRKIITKTTGRSIVYISDEMLHAKFLFVDQKHLLIGSANFNKLSTNYSSELCALISGSSQIFTSMHLSINILINTCIRIIHIRQLPFNPLKALMENILC